MSPSDALITKSEVFWNLGVDIFGLESVPESTRLDVSANRLYYGLFLSVCAYACKHRGLNVENPNPNAHKVAKALIQAVAREHKEFLSFLSAYEHLATMRIVADYRDTHVQSSELTPHLVIKPANKIRTEFIKAAKSEIDLFEDVEFDLSQIT